MEKKKIKIKFVDFWYDFVEKGSTFYSILDEKYDIELCDDPDYIICSVYSYNYRQYDCIRLLISGENYSTDFNDYDYSIDYDEYDFLDRHFRMRFSPFRTTENFQYVYNMVKTKHLRAEELFRQKDSFCSFVYSNSVDYRNRFFDQLNKYKKIDSAGAVKNNTSIEKGRLAKIAFETKHKFSIAFENSVRTSYITEKLEDSFAAGTVPIYFGADDVDKYYNPEAMIIVRDISETPKIIERIKEIDNNDELYMHMLKQPAILPGKEAYFDNYFEEMKAFIYHIFDQPLKKAGRRNRYNRKVFYKHKNRLQRIIDVIQNKDILN